MKAVIQRRYGSLSDLEVRDVAAPVIADDEVLVRVRAASVHPDVWHVVTGRPYVLRLMGAGLFRPSNPIPGTDMAGVVESVGRDVTSFHAGDQVFGETTRTHMWTNGGAFAELVAVRAASLAAKPGRVTFAQAAAVPTSGFIALLNLRGGRLIRPGQRVLVNGAAGGVGSIALQLAKGFGAHVTGVDRRSTFEMLRALGADDVIDCATDDFTRRGAHYEFIFDVPGNRPWSECRKALTPDGKYVLIGHERFGASGSPAFGLLPHFFGMVARSLVVPQLRLGRSSVPTRAEAMATLRDGLAAGAITPVIDRIYPLEDVREALRHMVEGELRGKVIIGADVS